MINLKKKRIKKEEKNNIFFTVLLYKIIKNHTIIYLHR